MNMNINEWNKVIAYAKTCEIKIDNIRMKPYTQYNGTKGIEIQIFDAEGHYFKSVYSGIYENADDYITKINYIIKLLYM